jgi:hypothetical protein
MERQRAYTTQATRSTPYKKGLCSSSGRNSFEVGGKRLVKGDLLGHKAALRPTEGTGGDTENGTKKRASRSGPTFTDGILELERKRNMERPKQEGPK